MAAMRRSSSNVPTTDLLHHDPHHSGNIQEGPHRTDQVALVVPTVPAVVNTEDTVEATTATAAMEVGATTVADTMTKGMATAALLQVARRVAMAVPAVVAIHLCRQDVVVAGVCILLVAAAQAPGL